MTNFDEFVNTVTSKNNSKEEWAKAQKIFDSYTSICYEKFQTEMSTNEKIHFWKQTIKYQGEQFGYDNLDQILSPELQESLERDLKAFTEEGKEELSKMIREEITPELSNAIDNIVKGIEEVGESLKDWLKEVEKQ